MEKTKRSKWFADRPFALPPDRVLEALDTSSDGLAGEEARRRLEAAGPNRLPDPPRESLFRRFLVQFNNPLIYILIVASAVTALLGERTDSAIIAAVVLINAVVGFLQEGKAERALEGIRKMLSLSAQALRDGVWVQVDAEALVPGDVVRLRSGDRVPADMRLLEATNLRIEESALTGESLPAEKGTEPVSSDAGVGDRKSMAYSGSLVASGQGIGVVTGTGIATELGAISRMIRDVEEVDTPLIRQMKQFGKGLSLMVVGLAAVMLIAGWLLHGFDPMELFFAAIGFAVAAIPESLPAVLTVTLAIGVQKMADHNAIARKLNAVETLGSVTVICTDKTGTLTKNEMTARTVVTAAGHYEVSGTGYSPSGGITLNGEAIDLLEHGDLQALIEVMAVANDAVVSEIDGLWSLAGEPTEGALRTLGLKAKFSPERYRRKAVIPFESENKFMAVLVSLPDGGARILLKGAAGRLLDRSVAQRGADGSIVPIDRAFWEEQTDRISSRGLRLLAAAMKDVPDDKEDLSMEDIADGMIFLGMVGIVDPPRPEAVAAIADCQRAGIRVKMITGDYAGTAMAIGKEMGIGDGVHCVTGADLERATDDELERIAHENDVFARTSPEHKLRLVKALQKAGEVVSMTGDGVNDAPALKRANVGVAMGIKGTEATKEAADIVLADDHFATIRRAVEEGRRIYDNLQKAITFLLPSNGAEAIVILSSVLFGFILPLTPAQILWINIVTDVSLALALAFEPAEQGLMLLPPRAPDAPIIGGAFLRRVVLVSLLLGGGTLAVFLMEIGNGAPIALARTVAVTTLSCGQGFYLLNSRFLRKSSLSLRLFATNPVAWVSLALLAVTQLLFVYAPFMNRWFGSVPLTLRHWILPLLVGAGTFLVVEGEKMITGRRAVLRGEGDG